MAAMAVAAAKGEAAAVVEAVAFDLAVTTVRALNSELHAPSATTYEVLRPQGAHVALVVAEEALSVHAVDALPALLVSGRHAKHV